LSTADDALLDAIDRRGRNAARTLLDDLAARRAHTLVVAGPARDPAGPSPASLYR
jgi:hypothetical protein